MRSWEVNLKTNLFPMNSTTRHAVHRPVQATPGQPDALSRTTSRHTTHPARTTHRSAGHRMAVLLTILLATSLTTPVHAQHDHHGELTFTIYQNGITLVHDARSLSLDEGRNQIALYGLPASLQFNSVLPVLNGSVSEVTLDMRQPGFQSVMQHLVGRQVRLDHTDGSSISGHSHTTAAT